MTAEIGKTLILFGGLLVCLGLMMRYAGLFSWLGRLPGDIAIQGERVSFYFPLMTCVIISLALSLLFFFLRR